MIPQSALSGRTIVLEVSKLFQRSRFRDPDLIKRNQAEETGLKRNPEQGLFKAYIPKQLEHVVS